VAVDYDFYVFEPKAEGGHVPFDLRDGFSEATVEQDVPPGSGNQK
jgi:hypothetical protein